MKRRFFSLFLMLALLPMLSACQKTDYVEYISDERCDLFCAETESYSILVSCLNRERPFLTDGVVSTKSKSVEAVLTEKEPTGKEYEIYFLEDIPRGGEMSFRSVSGDYAYSRGIDEFPHDSISLRIVTDGKSEELMATSVRTPQTLSIEAALDFAVKAESETLARMTRGGEFAGEFHVRLLRRDKNYFYVGIVDREGGTVSLLLDSETGAVLARREKR